MPLESQKDRISKDFVALRTDGEVLSDAVETLRDAGSVFSIVLATSVDRERMVDALPVLIGSDPHSFQVATGVVTLRWTASMTEIGALLEAEGVDLIRNYGSGGMVRPKKPEGPFELAERLQHLDFITSASVHIVSRAEDR